MIDGVSRLLQQHNENDERRWKPSELRANLRQLSNPFPRRPSKPPRRSCKFDRRAARLARNVLPPCDPRDCGAGIAEQLTDFRSVLQPMRRDAVPALAALARVAPLLERRGYRWEPGRSVDFELATRSDSHSVERSRCDSPPSSPARATRSGRSASCFGSSDGASANRRTARNAARRCVARRSRSETDACPRAHAARCSSHG